MNINEQTSTATQLITKTEHPLFFSYILLPTKLEGDMDSSTNLFVAIKSGPLVIGLRLYTFRRSIPERDYLYR